MNVLFLTTVLPSGLLGGGEIVSQSVVEALTRAGDEVRVLGYVRPGTSAVDRSREVRVAERPIETSAAGVRALGWMARAVVRRTPYSSEKYRSRAYLRAARAALAAHPDAVIVDHAQVHFAIAGARGKLPPLVFLAHNAESAMYREVAATAGSRGSRWAHGREARRIHAVEAGLARQAAQVWALTAEDAGYFRELAPGADVRTLEVASMMGAPAHTPEAAEYDVALIGNWTWNANCRGLEWFAEEVVPLLPPATKIAVAGAGAGWLDGRYPNVSVLGGVPDAKAFMTAARVVAVPSVSGGGVQVKTLDAVACGVPVVATGVATRGLKDLPASVAVADAPEHFAGHITRLAAMPDRERLRSEASDWSRARRQGLEEAVAANVADLAGSSREGQRPTPATVGA